MKSAIIIVSGSIDYFNKCIEYVINQSNRFDGIFVVSWGQGKADIDTIAKRKSEKIKIVEHTDDKTLEGNRNAALDYIKKMIINMII